MSQPAQASDLSFMSRVFLEGRTHNAWLKKEVTDQTLKELFDLTRMGPTAMNAQPLRIVYVKSPQAKAKLIETLMPGNVQKTQEAPVTAILALDTRFYDYLPKLFPHFPGAKGLFENDPNMARSTAYRDAALQSGYFILAARALGLDTGPMAGFSNEKLDQAFFSDGRYKSVMICNLGYGDSSKLHPRGPRLEFAEAAEIQ